jgi:hypothetical protein
LRRLQLGKQRQRLFGFCGVDHADGVAHVHDHVVPHLGLGHQRNRNRLADATQFDHGLVVVALFNQPRRYG